MRFAALLRPLAARFFQSVMTLWLVTVLFFILIEAIPYDFAVASATQGTSQEQIESLRYQLGLYASAPERYVKWLAGVLSGDLGQSWWLRQPITPILAEKLWHSTWLAGWALLVTLPIAIGLAFYSVVHQGSRFDRVASTVSIAAMSVPDFVIAYAIMFILAVQLDLFPAFTFYALDLPFLERLQATAMPIFSLAAVTITPVFRLTRASLLNELSSEYVQMAELKGLSRWTVLRRHVLPNAAAPIANAVVLTVAGMFFGLVIIESIFGYPGLGQLIVKAAQLRDMPLVQACALVTAVIYITLIYIADSISIISNPRLRYPSQPKVIAARRFIWPETIVLGPLRISRIAARALSLVVLAGGAWGTTIWWVDRIPKEREIVTVPPPSGTTRDKLTVAALQGKTPDLSGPVHYDYFKPFGKSGSSKHKLNGYLRVPRFKVSRRRADGRGKTFVAQFPDFQTGLIIEGDTLLPVARDRFLVSGNEAWYIILSAGRVWHEPADGDWSRGAFPFTMKAVEGFAPYYGVATFLFNGTEMSELRVQVAQETAHWAQYDLWGQSAVSFKPGPVPGAGDARREYGREQATRIKIRPWSDLADRYWRSLESFDGKGNRHNITVSGLMVDDTFYLRSCRTRAGPHPFCRQMRHGVFSITKSLGAGISMFWLAQKYGAAVFQEKLVDYIDIPASHDGWKHVTFGDALNMVTGIGDTTPKRVDHYVEADSSYIGGRVWHAKSIQAKLNAMARFSNYPWGPGEVFRYRSSDTTALSAAMDAYVKRQEGEDADLWDAVTREVLNPLGITRIPVQRSREPGGKRGPAVFGSGMLITYEEALKLARLLQDHGVHNGRQLLHRELTRRATSTEMDRGYPNGWRTWEGIEGRYELSFWLHPNVQRFGCDLRIPTMSGFGGNYINIMPGRMIGLRFADGHDDDPHTWDSYGIRSIANRVRPFCG